MSLYRGKAGPETQKFVLFAAIGLVITTAAAPFYLYWLAYFHFVVRSFRGSLEKGYGREITKEPGKPPDAGLNSPTEAGAETPPNDGA